MHMKYEGVLKGPHTHIHILKESLTYYIHRWCITHLIREIEGTIMKLYSMYNSNIRVVYNTLV